MIVPPLTGRMMDRAAWQIEERAAGVGGETGVPIGDGKGVCRTESADAGVVDQDVQPAQINFDGIEEIGNLFRPRQIDDTRRGMAAAIANGIADRVDLGLGACQEHQRAPRSASESAIALPSPGRAGDNGHLAAEIGLKSCGGH